MKRRDFLHRGALGTAAALLPAAACRPVPGVPPFALEESTLADLQAGMAAGRYTAVQLAERYRARIAQVDPLINAVIELNPDAVATARALDAERAAGTTRGPLHGVPVLLKDNIDTADRMQTTAGSLALAGHVAPRDAFLVERLRAAGAVLLGKTNLSEWANFRSTRSSSGWSGRGGQTRNPYVLSRSPCGSSSGSAAAVAANLCAVAVGTETDGSIICPATTNGIVGVKPTLGLVSRAGIIPIAHSQDTAGPMARTVADAAALLGVMAGSDPRDPATAAGQGGAHDDYTQFLTADGLRGARIGVARNYFGFNPSVDRLMNAALDVLRAQGAEVVDADIETRGQYGDAEYEVLLYEFKHDLNAYLKTVGPDHPRTLAELIAWNEAHADASMPYFGQEIFLMAQEKGDLTDPDYRDALDRSKRLAGTEGIDKTLAGHRLDAIVAPSGGPAWTIDWVNGDHYGGGSAQPAAVSGYPNVTVPAGFVLGLPVGLSFMGTAWSEPTLLRLAYAYEQASHHRRPPQFLERVGG